MTWHTARAWKRCTVCRRRILASAQRHRCVECGYAAERARERERRRPAG